VFVAYAIGVLFLNKVTSSDGFPSLVA